jgi:hypothetical protein
LRSRDKEYDRMKDLENWDVDESDIFVEDAERE